MFLFTNSPNFDEVFIPAVGVISCRRAEAGRRAGDGGGDGGEGGGGHHGHGRPRGPHLLEVLHGPLPSPPLRAPAYHVQPSRPRRVRRGSTGLAIWPYTQHSIRGFQRRNVFFIE